MLRVTGEITNTGRQELRDVEVRLRLSATRLGSRAELAAVAEGRTTSRDGEPIVSTTLPDLDAGETTTFAVSRALDELPQLTGFGVYVLGVEVLAGRPSGFGRVAMVRTMLPWVPKQPDFLPTGYTWLWPLVSRPSRLSNGTFSDDVLAGEMAADGRLSLLLDAGSRIQDSTALTWVVDPELLAAAADMANGYRVQAPDGSTVPGGGSGIAGLWLDRLRTLTAGRPVLALPYGDPDLVALYRHRRAGDIVRADALSDATVADTLPLASRVSDISWPVDGFANRGTLGVLRGDGRTSAVLDGRAVPPEHRPQLHPGRPGRPGDPVREGRRAARRPGAGRPAAPARPRPAARRAAVPRRDRDDHLGAAEHRHRADDRRDAAAPVGPRPGLPRPAGGDRGRAVDRVGAAADPGADLAAGDRPAAAGLPGPQRRRELPALYLRALDSMHTSISLLSAILTDPTQLIPEFERSVMLLESSWWRGRPSRANRLDREKDLLKEARTSVRVQPGNFTFSSRSGTIPVTVANELTQEVEVVLRLDPQTPRLRVDPVEPFTIGPQSKRQIPVSASAVASGPVVVDAQLYTVGGAAYGQPVPLQISITQYGTAALYITAVAAGVLFLAAGVRVLRRVVAARRREPEPPQVADQTEVTEPVP